MERRIEKVDMISQLPESILHRILSFLSLQQAVRLCVLSKTWKHVCHTLPILESDRMHYHRAKSKKQLKYLEKILLKRHMEMISINGLILEMELLNNAEYTSLIDRCLCYAIGSNVRELKLNFMLWVDHRFRVRSRFYNVPQIVFCSKLIACLEFQGCKLELSRSKVMLPSLKILSLKKVDADDLAIKNLFAGCPLIEYLRIDACRDFKCLELSGLCKLNQISLWLLETYVERVNINGSNVQSIELVGPFGRQHEINIGPCMNLKCLKLSTLTAIDDEWLYNHISELPFLEYLDIFACQFLRSIKISSPSLKKFSITSCSELVEIIIETPNLSIFKYFGPIIFFSSNDLALSKTELYFYSKNIDTQWYVKFIELLEKFDNFSKVLDLGCETIEGVIVPIELRQILSPPLTSVKCLKFTKYLEFMHLAEVVDGLLWLSPHSEILSVKNAYDWSMELQFSYKKQFICEEETPHCCQSLPVSCWQNCIKKVKIKEVKIKHTITSWKKIIDVKRHCFEDDILEKIDDLCKDLIGRSQSKSVVCDSCRDK